MALTWFIKVVNKLRRPHLRNLLFGMNLLVLSLPLAGIFVLRVYENELIRQTESELIAQGAVVVANYKVALKRYNTANKKSINDYGKVIKIPETMEAVWAHQVPRLDVAQHDILPAAPESNITPKSPPEWLLAIGRDLSAILQEAQRYNLAAIRVLDDQGTVIASTRGQLLESLAHWPEVEQSLRGEVASVLRERPRHEKLPPLASISRSARLRVFVALPVTEEKRMVGVVLLSRTPRNIAQALYDYRFSLSIAGALLLLIIISLTAFASLTITRPVAAVMEQAKRVLRGDRNVSLQVKHLVTFEMHQLSDAVNQMAHILAQRADYLRDFAAHITHAFKTPLTSIQGAIELFQDHLDKMSSTERQQFLKNMHEDTQYLTALVNRLLELARADTLQAQASRTNVLLVLEKCRDQYASQGLRVYLDNCVDTQANIDATILESILCNLFTNAIQQGATSIHINSSFSADKTNIALILADNGVGIPEENYEKIFQPFFTTTKHLGGTGLGLAVVRSLLRAHQGDIQLVAGTAGAIFKVELADW